MAFRSLYVVDTCETKCQNTGAQIDNAITIRCHLIKSRQTNFSYHILFGNIKLWVMRTLVMRSSFLFLISHMLSLKITKCPLRRSCQHLKYCVWDLKHNTSIILFAPFFILTRIYLIFFWFQASCCHQPSLHFDEIHLMIWKYPFFLSCGYYNHYENTIFLRCLILGCWVWEREDLDHYIMLLMH